VWIADLASSSIEISRTIFQSLFTFFQFSTVHAHFEQSFREICVIDAFFEKSFRTTEPILVIPREFAVSFVTKGTAQIGQPFPVRSGLCMDLLKSFVFFLLRSPIVCGFAQIRNQ
jgi:hypothetical protein